MKKPLAGKRYFEAMGRRAASKKTPVHYGRIARQQWPMWARRAWALGWLDQSHTFERST